MTEETSDVYKFGITNTGSDSSRYLAACARSTVMESANFAAPANIGSSDSEFKRNCAIARVRTSVIDMTHCWNGSPTRADVRALLEAYDQLQERVDHGQY